MLEMKEIYKSDLKFRWKFYFPYSGYYIYVYEILLKRIFANVFLLQKH